MCVFVFSHPCGALPAECVIWAGFRRRAGVPSGPSRGRRNPHFGRTVLKCEFVDLPSNLIFVTLFGSGVLTLFSLSLHKGPNWVATLNAGKGGAHASYYHRANKEVEKIPPCLINTFTLDVFYR